MAVSARRARTRRIIAVGATVAAIALLGPVAERGAFWNLTLLVTVVLVTWTVAIRRPVVLRRVFLALASAGAVVTAIEAGMREVSRPASRPSGSPPVAYMPDVGHCAAASSVSRSKLRVGARPVYDVRYTIDQSGLRATTPASPEAKSSDAAPPSSPAISASAGAQLGLTSRP